jgi:hypothetical protein
MRHVKFAFLPVVALLAIALTAATKADVLKTKRQAITCNANIDYYAINRAGVWYYNPAFPAPPAPNLTVCPGHGAKFCAVLNNLYLLPNNITCNGTNTFCCAKITTPNTCTAPEVLVQTWCKP